MNYRKLLFPVLALLWGHALFATDLTIENIRAVYRPDVAPDQARVIFDLRWKNAWNNDRNHDAVWVFVKLDGYYNNHVKLKPAGHRVLVNRLPGTTEPRIEVAADSLGILIYPSGNYRGDVDLKLELLLDQGRPFNGRRLQGNFQVYGLEMVYIPAGGFTLGSPDDPAREKAAFYRSDAAGEPDGLFEIRSEAAIPVGPNAGELYYWSENALYNGDQQGPIPEAFPKGFRAFYIMKYELTQGQYAAFLNHLPDTWTYVRSPLGGRDYYEHRGGIRLIDGKYVADNPKRPMNYVSFTDGLAYTDWAALRPLTELEYEKAVRGPAQPIPGEFVWGTNNYDQLERYVTPDAELVLANGHSESELTDANRPVFGASYYWVMDLSGSVWEKVITVGNPVGRQFVGSHGDGNLSFGHATNADWPKSDDEVGGFGYRGGGYYEVGRSYDDFNPHSPVGYRYYGAWSGGPRSIAYGYRAGRTAQ
ncbi:formylglycine-generating enzyme family protein [Flavilitoribacter nigricans]|uniref:Sulfatase-modifying factor enzyme-like domain-containing protein n=1 Tax=Flavilitoribacter nigricans (strain ATCC 23147 / DSM 23189 / NBRC 102662 / NCIMB 1420 / SS-2) TaxID=1122177 RepID=A0A2D0MXD3_FLAN2|nr:SUMF1/EgtB/PvdO family nonheme iron enzyme [Flavilitoribacter nigricans]PHN00840.1 hypothetical protein CRP01_40095 [Flavilitoribacter nigricans DSM 23189 = NBRC 102662]